MLTYHLGLLSNPVNPNDNFSDCKGNTFFQNSRMFTQFFLLLQCYSH